MYFGASCKRKEFKHKQKKTRRLAKRKTRKRRKKDNCNEITNRNNNNENRDNNNITNVYILGDSMSKKLNRYLLTKKIRHKHLVKVRSFSGEKTSCMTDHVKPTLPGSYCSTCRHKGFKNRKYSQSNCESYNR